MRKWNEPGEAGAQAIEHGKTMVSMSPSNRFTILHPGGAAQHIKAVTQSKDDRTCRHLGKCQAIHFVLGDENPAAPEGRALRIDRLAS